LAADGTHVVVYPIQQGDHGHLVRNGDGHALIAQGAERLHGEGQVGLIGDVVLPELPGEAVVGVHRIEHPIDGVFRHRMAHHPGHLLLGRDHGLEASDPP
jgi:hypothetical protein